MKTLYLLPVLVVLAYWIYDNTDDQVHWFKYGMGGSWFNVACIVLVALSFGYLLALVYFK